MIWTIYCVTNLAEGKEYVGQTIQSLGRRMSSHRLAKSLLGEALRYTPEVFTIWTLAFAYSQEEADRLETYWISKCNALYPLGYNIRPTGGSHSKHVDASKTKCREATRGHVVTTATRAKMRIKALNRSVSEETRLKLRGEASPRAKLNDIQVLEIKELLKAGNLLQREIADMYGVTSRNISAINRGILWKHLH